MGDNSDGESTDDVQSVNGHDSETYLDVTAIEPRTTGYDPESRTTGYDPEPRTTGYGPEPALVKSPYKLQPSKVHVKDTIHEIKPNITAFSCTLLLWVISFVVFLIAYFALSGNGLWCPSALNNETLVRKGLMISDMDTSFDPCTNIYDYACGGYFKTHSMGSTLYDMQTTAYIELGTVPPFTPSDIHTTDSNRPYFATLIEFAILGIYPGFEVSVLPSIREPLEYALYIEASNVPAAVSEYYEITAAPACFTPASTPLLHLITSHIQMGHTVFAARETDLCSAYALNQTIDRAITILNNTLFLSKWSQIQMFYQNTISSGFAKGKSNTYIITFVERIRKQVIDYITTGIQWLDGPSRQKAIDKIKHVTILAGAGMANIDDCNATNTLACLDEQWHKTLALIGSAVNPLREWKMAATEVNAYYSPLHNHICIPYGIATTPLFSLSYPDEWNLAGLGIIIAHELGHSIDAYDGVLFDAGGAYDPWLTPTASAKLHTYVSCMSKEYEDNNMSSAIAQLSTDENMADQIAVHSIFAPFSHMTGLKYASTESLVLFAQTWCRVGGTLLRKADTTDPHAANVLRVNNTLQYLPAFQHSFHCPLVPDPCTD